MQTPPAPSPDDAKFQALLASHNYTVPAAPSAGGWYDKLNPPAKTPPAPSPDMGELAANQFEGAGNKIVGSVTGASDNIAQDIGKIQSPGRSTPQRMGDVADVAKNVGEAGLGTASGAVQGIFAPITATIQKALQLNPLAAKPANTDVANPFVDKNTGTTLPSPTAEALHTWAQAHPEAAKNLMDVVNVGAAGVGGSEGILGKEAANTTVGEGVNAVKNSVQDAHGAVHEFLNTPYPESVGSAGPSLLERTKNSLATNSVSPQTQVSAERLAKQAPLQGAGAARQAKPLDVYNEFAGQQDRHLADIKQDPAISIVGSRIGDAFKDVVKQRQEAGKTMASELEGFANKPVDASTAQTALSKELSANNLIHNAGEGELTAKGQTKMSAPDQKILEHYANELHELGPKPTAADLDAFLGRIPNDIKGLKATNGINFKTNAERIISSNMNMLRDSLTSMSTPAYKDARTQYADLSNFVKEGAPFLGKVTQSGDFAKDASIAKSAVQSVLNNGKKDWLLKLEEHTGYPALDEATLALQAMKDSGDFKGNSLLDLMTNNGKEIPTTPKGVVGRLLDWSAAKGKDMLVGSPADQTRQYLQSLEKTKK